MWRWTGGGSARGAPPGAGAAEPPGPPLEAELRAAPRPRAPSPPGTHTPHTEPCLSGTAAATTTFLTLFIFFYFIIIIFFYDKNRFSLGLLSFSPGVRPKVPRLFWQGGHIFCGAVPRNGHGRSGIVITDFLFRYAKCIEWKCSSWCQRSKRSQRGKDMVFRHKRGIYCTDDLL